MAGGPIRLVIASKFDPKGINTAESSMKKFGGIVGQIATVAVAAIGGISVAATQMAAEFETSFAKIEGLVGVSTDQLGELEEAARTLGPQFGKSANEAAEALFFITSAGLRGEDAINVLEASLKGAAIGLGDTKTIADLATSAVNAYGASQLDGAKAVDVLTEAVRLGKLEPAELAGAMGAVLPLASNLNVSFAEVGAAMAGMSKTGTDASTAATQLRQILATLAKPTAEADEALANMGMSAEGLREQIKEEGLFATLETLTGAFDGNIEATTAVFGNIRALSGVLDLMGASAEDNKELFALMTDEVGVLDEALEITQDTAANKFAVAMETMKASLLPVGDILLDVAANMLDAMGPVIDDMGPLLEEVFTELEPVMGEFAALLPELIRSLFPLLPIFGDIFEVVMTLINTALPPLIELFDVIGPLVADMVEVFAEFIGDALEMLAPVLMDIVEAITPIIEAAFPIMMELMETLIPIVLELVEMFLPLLDYVLPLLEALILDLVLPALDLFVQVLSVALPWAMEMFKEVGLGRLLLALGDFSEDFQMFVYRLRLGWAEGFNEMIVVIEAWINKAISALNWFVEKANSLPGIEIDFSMAKVELGRLDMPELPRFVRDMQSQFASAVNTGTMEGIMAASGAAFSMGIERRDFRGTSNLQDIDFFSNIPQLADGALVKSRPGGILANIGEGNFDEAVVPLRPGMGLGSNITINVNAGMGTDGARVGEAVVKAIKSYERTSGPVFARA